MFIYLSKKIAIPNNIPLRSLAWNPEHGWIAAGGDEGLLKVLKLESASNLSMNQTLEGHRGSVVCVTWNANYRKLTTSDQHGLIIVWMLHKGVWFEEMINNRNKSVVRAMKWTGDGQKICIVYEDGAVIVGSVDGNRLWGKDLPTGLRNVSWSPDAKSLLFATADDELHVYDAMGTKVKAMTTKRNIVAVDWYDGVEGNGDPHAPSLAVGYENGVVELYGSAEDTNPLLLETGLRLHQCKWNMRGTVLAIAGQKDASSVVEFYGARGAKLRALKVPGSSGTTGLSWEGNGLRIALAVDSYIYFANIRPEFQWGYFAGRTLVAAFADRTGTAVVFWNLRTNSKVVKRAPGLRAIRAAGDYCILVCSETQPNDDTVAYRVSLRNALGVVVESRLVKIEPKFAAMTFSFAVIADDRYVYAWQFGRGRFATTSAVSELLSHHQASGRERLLDMDDGNNVAYEDFELRSKEHASTGEIADKIKCACASDRMLLVALESGAICQFTLPHLVPEKRHQSSIVPWKMAINCDNSKLAIIDSRGSLGVLVLEGEEAGLLPFERRDAWDVRWADDDKDLFAAMEKTRLYVYAGNTTLEAEEPVACAGVLARFSKLAVTSVVVEDVVDNPDRADKTNVIVTHETSALRAVRKVLETSGSFNEAAALVEAKPHPELWKCLADAALEALDLGFADKAFVKCKDYQGIQFVKRLRVLSSDRMKQRAEVAAFFARFEEADHIYRDIDRPDLAVQLWTRLGDWHRVVRLLKHGSASGDDDQLAAAYANLGDNAAYVAQWDKARAYYDMAKNMEKSAEACYRVGDFESLERLASSVPDGSPLLIELGRKFESVGLHEAAVDAYTRAREPKKAVDCCILLNQWEKAIELAERYGYQQIEGLLVKYATKLVNQDKRLLAVELYRKANRAPEAAKLLAKVAEDTGIKGANPVRAKKLHVLAALEVERYRQKALDLTLNRPPGADVAQTTAATLDTLMTHDQETGFSGAKVLDNAWRGAAAFHYFLLAHRQLYGGQYDAAKFTAIRLAEFEDIIDRPTIYSLLGMCAFHAKDYYACSRAFTKLELLETNTEEEKGAYEDLAFQIFIEYPPDKKDGLAQCYEDCLDWAKPYVACTVTGCAVDGRRTIQCPTCRHHALETELKSLQYCPLCHVKYPPHILPLKVVKSI